jgi:hypothetical protein
MLCSDLKLYRTEKIQTKVKPSLLRTLVNYTQHLRYYTHMDNLSSISDAYRTPQ